MKKLILLLIIPLLSFGQSGDTNGDGFTNLEDLFNVLDDWLQNVNDNDPQAISNLDEMTNLVDSLITLSYNINTQDIRFPDGISSNSVIFSFSGNNSFFQVPEDSTLYIIQHNGNGASEELLQIYNGSPSENESYGYVINETTNYNFPNTTNSLLLPVIVAGGQYVYGGGNFYGFLVEKKSSVLTGKFDESAYTVPSDSVLYITNFYGDSNIPDESYLKINDISIWTGYSNKNGNKGLANPIIIKEGNQVNSSNTINGYLVHKDYFSSVSNSNSNDVSEENTTYQVGDTAHGGVVVYVTPSGEHGLVMQLGTIGNFESSCVYQTSFCNTIVKGITEFYPDWRLPTNDELYSYVFPNYELFYNLGFAVEIPFCTITTCHEQELLRINPLYDLNSNITGWEINPEEMYQNGCCKRVGFKSF